MVLEQFIDRELVTKHFTFVLLLSALFVFVSYGVYALFFPTQSVTIILLATILLVPSMHHLIVIEEKVERTGSKQFLARHKTIIRCYLGAFCGLVLGFLILGALVPETIHYQASELEQTQLRPELIANFGNFEPTTQTALAVFTHNLQFLIIGFFLAIFYGAGAIFIVAYTASFFSAFILELSARFSNAPLLGGVALIHLVPENAGFLLAAIAGATLSRALIHEKLSGQPFKNVLQNVFLLLVIGIGLLLAAAFIETYGTAVIFQKLIV